jgi:hypothetical protein
MFKSGITPTIGREWERLRSNGAGLLLRNPPVHQGFEYGRVVRHSSGARLLFYSYCALFPPWSGEHDLQRTVGLGQMRKRGQIRLGSFIVGAADGMCAMGIAWNEGAQVLSTKQKELMVVCPLIGTLVDEAQKVVNVELALKGGILAMTAKVHGQHVADKFFAVVDPKGSAVTKPAYNAILTRVGNALQHAI